MSSEVGNLRLRNPAVLGERHRDGISMGAGLEGHVIAVEDRFVEHCRIP